MTRRMPVWLAGFTTLVLAFLHLPIIVLALFSFNRDPNSARWGGFTWEWYVNLLDRRDVLAGAWNSIVVGSAATLTSAVLGTLIALALRRRRFAGRSLLEVAIYVPLVTPEIVVGISLAVLFGSIGVVGGLTTIIIAHVAFCISFVTLVVLARLDGMDRSCEEAAMTLGADEFDVFRRVTLPRLWPGIVSGSLLAFILSFDDFIITSFVSGPGTSTLPIVIYGMATRRVVDPGINALNTVILAATSVLIYLWYRSARRAK